MHYLYHGTKNTPPNHNILLSDTSGLVETFRRISVKSFIKQQSILRGTKTLVIFSERKLYSWKRNITSGQKKRVG